MDLETASREDLLWYIGYLAKELENELTPVEAFYKGVSYKNYLEARQYMIRRLVEANNQLLKRNL